MERLFYGPMQDKTNYRSNEFLHINYCGVSQYKFYKKPYKARILRPDGRLDYQLLLVVNGRLEVEHCGRRIYLTSGDALLFFPKELQDYSYYLTANEPNALHYFVHFSGNEVENILDRLGITKAKTVFKASAQVERIFKNMVNEFNKRHELSVVGYLLRLLSEIADNTEYKNDSTHLIHNEAEYISAHFETDIDFDECAKRCNLSRSRFTHLFTEKIGISPSGYLQNLRIEQAIDMLLQSTQSIGEIAEAVGFSDARYFSRIFKKATSKTPSDFRRTK